MWPVLFTVAGFPISSFGLFLLLSFFAALFIVWRVVKLYDLDEEQTIDLIILTAFGGLIGARLLFVLLNYTQFISDPLKIVLITKYPGLSFWGAIFFGFLILKIFTSRLKINFYQIADFAVVGLILGLSISTFGCLLGSCQYGLVSNLPIAVDQVGLLGKRFPLQIVESGLLFLLFIYLWKSVLRFHQAGSILAKGLIFLGVFKLVLESFRGDAFYIYSGISLGHIFALVLILLGLKIAYKDKRSLKRDLGFIIALFYDRGKQNQVVTKIKRSCYNLSINLKISFKKLGKKIFKVLNVKSNPTKF